jgi:hypothetical protein
MDGTGSGLCLMAGVGINSVKPMVQLQELVNY